MDIEEKFEGDYCVLKLDGHFDAKASGSVEKKINSLLEMGNNTILLDMKDTSYISSAGLRVLLIAAKKIEAKKGRMILCSLNDSVKKVFDIAGFMVIFNVCKSYEDARDQFTCSL